MYERSMLAHRITGSGESTSHQSCRPRSSTTKAVRPHTLWLEVEEEGEQISGYRVGSATRTSAVGAPSPRHGSVVSLRLCCQGSICHTGDLGDPQPHGRCASSIAVDPRDPPPQGQALSLATRCGERS